MSASTKNPPYSFRYLCVSGGGGGGGSSYGGRSGGGGGGGGFRSSIEGLNSGGGGTVEPVFSLTPATYAITVGAGGTGNDRGSGGTSKINFFTALPGGGGSRAQSQRQGGSGASGGGGGADYPGGGGGAGGLGTAGQGFDGGAGGGTQSGSGGGAGGPASGGTPGVGITTDISGSIVTYSEGGTRGTRLNGPANSGKGGGGVSSDKQTNGFGGSGIIILQIPNWISVSFSAGVTQTSYDDGVGNNVYVVTAAGATDTFTLE